MSTYAGQGKVPKHSCPLSGGTIDLLHQFEQDPCVPNSTPWSTPHLHSSWLHVTLCRINFKGKEYLYFPSSLYTPKFTWSMAHTSIFSAV